MTEIMPFYDFDNLTAKKRLFWTILGSLVWGVDLLKLSLLFLIQKVCISRVLRYCSLNWFSGLIYTLVQINALHKNILAICTV